MQRTPTQKTLELSQPSFRNEIKIETVSDSRYSAKLVENSAELEQVLRLRFDVFKRELTNDSFPKTESSIDFDKYDLHCDHLIVKDNKTGEAVGTYRLNTIEGAKNVEGFYAHTEFSIEDLPADVLDNSIELGRACIAKEHRNSKVLFMLWKGLANYSTAAGKRYLFGCCSIFTQDGEVAARVLQRLKREGNVHESIQVSPRDDRKCLSKTQASGDPEKVELPALVNIYLRIGAKICGEPAIDRELKTIDYFVIFDLKTINKKYLRMFFGDKI